MKMIKLSNIAQDLLQESIVKNARSMEYVVNKIVKNLANSFSLPSEDEYRNYLNDVLKLSGKNVSYRETLRLPFLGKEYNLPDEIHVSLGDALEKEDLEYIEKRLSPTQNFIDFLDYNIYSTKKTLNIVLRPQVGLLDEDLGEYDKDIKTIIVTLPIDNVRTYLSTSRFQNYQVFFRDMLGNALIHELQHAYDDWQSGGRALIKPEDFKNLLSNRMSSMDSYTRYLLYYLNLPSERAAYIQEALKMFFDNLSKLQSPQDLLKAYKNKGLNVITHNPIVKSLMNSFIEKALTPNIPGRIITEEYKRKVYKVFYKILSLEMEALEKELSKNK